MSYPPLPPPCDPPYPLLSSPYLLFSRRSSARMSQSKRESIGVQTAAQGKFTPCNSHLPFINAAIYIWKVSTPKSLWCSLLPKRKKKNPNRAVFPWLPGSLSISECKKHSVITLHFPNIKHILSKICFPFDFHTALPVCKRQQWRQNKDK